MPTFDAEDRFRQEYLRLDARKKAAFLKARDDFRTWLIAKKQQPNLAPPAHLRLHFIESQNCWSITFGGDERALWRYGKADCARRGPHHLGAHWRPRHVLIHLYGDSSLKERI